MSTKTEPSAHKLIDILATDILSSAEFEELSDTTTILLTSENYNLLISSSELMSHTFKKIDRIHKNNFIVYPIPKDMSQE